MAMNSLYQPIVCSDEAYYPLMFSLIRQITPPNYSVSDVISSRCKKIYNGKCCWTVYYKPNNVIINTKKTFQDAVLEIKLEKPHRSKVVAWGRTGSSTFGIFITYGNPYCTCIQDFRDDLTPFPILEQRSEGEGACLSLVHELDFPPEDQDEELIREPGEWLQVTSIYATRKEILIQNCSLIFCVEYVDYEGLVGNFNGEKLSTGFLKELLAASPVICDLHNRIEEIMPGIQYCLANTMSTPNKKIDVLRFVGYILQTDTPQIFHQYIKILIPLVVDAVSDTFYKISSEALLVLQHLVKVICPLDVETNFEFTPFALQIYECTVQKLDAQEVHQEVKDRAIACMGQIIANMGDVGDRIIH